MVKFHVWTVALTGVWLDVSHYDSVGFHWNVLSGSIDIAFFIGGLTGAEKVFPMVPQHVSVKAGHEEGCELLQAV